MNDVFVIIGGGCYGSYYVHQLLEARERGKLTWRELVVLDRDPDCQVAQNFDDPGITTVQTEWEEWGAALWQDPQRWADQQLVPAPIAPHIVRHWLVGELSRRGVTVEDQRWTAEVPELPYADVTAGGQLVVSHAPGLCPTNCIEPRSCPLTGGKRTWEMSRTVAAASPQLAHVATLECSHFAYGVGTIPLNSIYSALETLHRLERPSAVGIATVSKCHGLVDVVELR